MSAWTRTRDDRNFLVECYAETCDLAAPYGLTVDLEFPSFSRLRTLDEALDIVRAADQPNGGILVDTLYLHLSRVDSAELLHVPSELLHFLHVSDALPGIADTREGMIQLARDARLYPGEGCIDFRGIIERMPPVDYAIELPNQSRVAELGYEEHARRCLVHARRIFGSVRSERRQLDPIPAPQITSRRRNTVARELTEDDRALVEEMLARARAAMAAVEGYTQQRSSTDWRRRSAGTPATRRPSPGWRSSGSTKAASATGPGPPRQAVQDLRRAARCASPEEHGHHRGGPGQGHRQICQAGRGHRLPDPDDQSRAHPAGDRHLRGQGARRGDLLPPSADRPHDRRDGRRDALGLPRRGRARGSVPGHHQAVDPAHPTPDGGLRSDPCHRRQAHGQSSL